MKKIYILSAFFLVTARSFACDICGCGLGNYYLGILPQFSHRFIGFRYQFNQFKTVMANDATQYSRDFYRTVELWGGWNMGKKWRAMAFLPFNMNHQVTDDGIHNKNRMGDVAVMLDYKIFDKSKSNDGKRVYQQLWAGVGIKLPTGKFDVDINDPSLAALANTQTGSGSTDIMFNAAYNLKVNKFGFNAITNYKMNTGNKDKYQFGDKLTLNSFVSYSARSGKIAILPNAGLLYEHASPSKLNNEKIDLTGGSLLLAAAGMEFGFNEFTIGFNAQLPISQNFAQGQTQSKIKGMLHVTFAL